MVNGRCICGRGKRYVNGEFKNDKNGEFKGGIIINGKRCIC